MHRAVCFLTATCLAMPNAGPCRCPYLQHLSSPDSGGACFAAMSPKLICVWDMFYYRLKRLRDKGTVERTGANFQASAHTHAERHGDVSLFASFCFPLFACYCTPLPLPIIMPSLFGALLLRLCTNSFRCCPPIFLAFCFFAFRVLRSAAIAFRDQLPSPNEGGGVKKCDEAPF